MAARFEPIAIDPSCRHCTGPSPLAALGVEAVYCISVAEQQHRTELASRHFHDIGLCRGLTFHRPHRRRNVDLAVWQSHRAVAEDALQKGFRRVLVLEDDARFSIAVDALVPRLQQAQRALPADWWGLFLGHLPFQAYFVGRGLMRVRSACMHAYVAHAPLLDWLATTPPMDAAIPMSKHIGASLDGATANLPGMYALFPMVAMQTFLGAEHLQGQAGPLRRWSWKGARWAHYLTVYRGARMAEAIAILGSPLHRLTLDRFRLRAGRWLRDDAMAIRASGLFDADFYLRSNPDVANSETDPLWHYVRYGASEGRWPSASFDPAFYAKHAPTLRRKDNPLLHYITVGRPLGHPAHPGQAEVPASPAVH